MNKEEIKKIAKTFFYEGTIVGRHYTPDRAGHDYLEYMFDYT